MTKTTTAETLELFTWADGTVTLAWVVWEFRSDGERRCLSARRLAGT
jgi:hypothetical protein